MPGVHSLISKGGSMPGRTVLSRRAEAPVIACFNRATAELKVDWDALMDALQVYVSRHVAPVWGTPARLQSSSSFIKGAWGIVFVNNAHEAEDLGYHELTPHGMPLSKVYVEPTLMDGYSVSSTVSHELVEMLVDPAINLYASGPRPATFYSYESADPVEEDVFTIDGIEMSDFVYPAYFEAFHKPGSMQFDEMDKVKRPFEIRPGGYQQLYWRGRWRNYTVRETTAERLAREDRRYHRSELRKRPGVRRRSRG
jgi:hypothetical protein